MHARRLIPLLAMLFLLSAPLLCASACPEAKRQIKVAAVVGEAEGGIFTLEAETRPGHGGVYTSINPMMGYAAQESEQQAVDFAFESAGMDKSGCDVFFRVEDAFGEGKIDGPSAGGAMAVAVRAALLGKQIRQDVVMTGTISPGGNVGEVGGVLEKSIAASGSGAHYMLVPSMQVYESFLVSSVSGSRNFSSIVVKNITDAERVLYSRQSEKFAANFSPKSKPIPKSLPEIRYDADLGRFSLVAKKTVDDMEATSRQVMLQVPNSTESGVLSGYFSGEISKYREQISMGYPFTAANSAFLLSIDAQYVRLGAEQPDMDAAFETVSSCISALQPPIKTRQNFHWATGADLRRIWAYQRLNQSKEQREDQSGYITLRDLYYAYSWCKISESLSEQANDVGGDPVDESVLASLAGEKLSEAEGLLLSSPAESYDAAWHLENGYVANETGDYGAAIYEATYAMNAQEVSDGAAGSNMSSALEKLLSADRTSLWGKIYFGQGKYVYYDSLEGGFSPSDSYTVLRYSSKLDDAAKEMDSALSTDKAMATTVPFTQIPLSVQGKPKGAYDLLVIGVFSFFLGILGSAALWRAFLLSRRD